LREFGRPYGARRFRAEFSQDFVLGYYRRLPPGAGALAFIWGDGCVMGPPESRSFDSAEVRFAQDDRLLLPRDSAIFRGPGCSVGGFCFAGLCGLEVDVGDGVLMAVLFWKSY
jgi:hypothetical protein